MKSLLKSVGILMFAIVIVSTSSNVFAKDKNAEYFKEYQNIVEDMYKTMKSFPDSGNVDLDYLNEMIAHHEAAVNMSKNYLEYNKWTKEIKLIAQDIIANQSEDNKHMEAMIKEIQDKSVGDKDKESQYLLEYSDILSNMYGDLMNLKSTEKIDRDYLNALIIHHKGAVDMFDLIIKYSDNEDLKKMAEKEKQELSSEISKMDMILQKTKDFKTHDLK
ncbi:MAG: DUF305 domain-containing protein [Terrisporobacter sp.]|uniref:DUF305 domain-containing protein n=1 Tax=Terrisporobacter sp. TaxID=1965305 RepID=UPI002FC99073